MTQWLLLHHITSVLHRLLQVCSSGRVKCRISNVIMEVCLVMSCTEQLDGKTI